MSIIDSNLNLTEIMWLGHGRNYGWLGGDIDSASKHI